MGAQKVVLVTGASSGLGHAIAKALAAKNHRVFGTARVPRAGASDGFTTLPLDVTQDESVAACIAEIVRATGRIDVVVNNAGFGIAGAIEAYTEALRMEVRPLGIRVSMIEPGDFATSFTASRRMTRESIPASPYYEPAVRAIATMARDEQANQDLSPVTQAVEAILECRRPALRYPRANAVQRTFNALRPFLPQTIAESLIRSTYGLN